VVFLDEPTTGLGIEARHALWNGIRAFHTGGGTVLLTSHYLEEIEALAQRGG
jgi:ABC-2 type transport system ATP-binding protein